MSFPRQLLTLGCVAIYNDKGPTHHRYYMFGVDGKVYGECIQFPSNGYHCGSPGGPIIGNRKFRCLTSFTAKQITGRN